MRSKNSIIFIIAVILAFVYITAMISCTHSPQQSAVSFSSDIVPILNSGCAVGTDCHIGANGYNQQTNFDSDSAYYTISKKGLVNLTNPPASLLYAEVEEGQMPLAPYPQLSSAQKNVILKWIQQGAKNN